MERTWNAPDAWWMKPDTFDLMLAVGLTLLAWLQVAVVPFLLPVGLPGPPAGGAFIVRSHVPTFLTFFLLGGCFLPLAFRRRFPFEVLAVTSLAAAAYDLVPQPPALSVLGALIALYTVGTLVGRRRLALAACATAVALLVGSAPTFESRRWLLDIVRTVALVGVAAAIGDATRNNRAYIAEAEHRAEEAELNREEETRRQVDEERLRIARELHDITAHSLSIIAVQSGAAGRVIDSDPEQARLALENIRQTSKGALDELRGVLGVLRGVDESPAPLAPAPRLARIADLTQPVEQAGIEVDLDIGDLGDLPGLVDGSAYRIVQEALTNVVRHAGPAKVTVSIHRSADGLDVEVTDSGRGSEGDPGTGHGIPGMRERSVALGGRFEAGPNAGGGFSVKASLPLQPRGAGA